MSLMELAEDLGYDSTMLKLLKEFQSNAAVNYPGPQKAARDALTKLSRYITQDEYNHLLSAQGHATFVREGRGDLDYACQQIRKRILKEMLL